VQSRFGYPLGVPAPHDAERDKSPPGVLITGVIWGSLGPTPQGIRKELLAWKEQTWKTAAT